MTLSSLELLIIFCASLLLSGTFSMLEAAVISQDKHRLRHLADENDKNAIIMRRLLERTDRLLSALLLCNNLANVACAASATAIATRLLPGTDAALLWVTLLVTFILLVFAEVSPKIIGVRYASPIALALARLLDWLIRLLLPLIAIANMFSSALLRLIGIRNNAPWQTVMSAEELRAAVRAAARTQDDEHEHYHMAEKTLRLHELPVEKIMTPRREIYGINLQDDIAAIRRQIESAPHNKLPVFRGNLDNTLGTIDALRALRLIGSGRLSPAALEKTAEAVTFIPAATAALRQLQSMRRQRQRLGLVVDGSGRVVGMLSFADFAAAILGEEEMVPLTARSDGALVVSGDITLLQLEQLQPGATAPPEVDASTVNGMILEYLGDLPQAPLCLQIKSWRLEIIAADDKSIQRVALLPPAAEAAADSAG